MALKERVEDYTGTFSDTTALNVWFLESARRHFDLSPPMKMGQYLQRVNTTLPSPVTHRILEVWCAGVQARKGDPALQYLYDDQKSLQYATTEDPVFFIHDGIVDFLPALQATADATTGALCIVYPTAVNSTVDSTIANAPAEMTDLVVQDVALRALHQLLGILTTQYTALSTRLNTEEDIELSMAKMKEMELMILDYRTKIGTLRETYMMALSAYTGRALASQKEAAQ